MLMSGWREREDFLLVKGKGNKTRIWVMLWSWWKGGICGSSTVCGITVPTVHRAWLARPAWPLSVGISGAQRMPDADMDVT